MADIVAKAIQLIMDPSFPVSKAAVVLELVRAARETALEEAARVADGIAADETALYTKYGDRYAQGKAAGARVIAAAIRAKKEVKHDPQ